MCVSFDSAIIFNYLQILNCQYVIVNFRSIYIYMYVMLIIKIFYGVDLYICVSNAVLMLF